jgi:antitoxin Phd
VVDLTSATCRITRNNPLAYARGSATTVANSLLYQHLLSRARKASGRAIRFSTDPSGSGLREQKCYHYLGEISILTRWPVFDAKARFSELLEKTIKEGPQLVTQRGVEAVVLVPYSEWQRLNEGARPTLKDLLLEPQARFDWTTVVPNRKRLRRRRVGSTLAGELLDTYVISELR